jgi:hypothetical protein
MSFPLARKALNATGETSIRFLRASGSAKSAEPRRLDRERRDEDLVGTGRVAGGFQNDLENSGLPLSFCLLNRSRNLFHDGKILKPFPHRDHLRHVRCGKERETHVVSAKDFAQRHPLRTGGTFDPQRRS